MERVSANAHVVGLGALLGRPASVAEPVAVQEIQPDPRVLLEQERQCVLEAARQEGELRGMQAAEETIQQQVLQARQAIEKQHAAELERLRVASERMETLLQELPKRLSELEDRSEALVVEVAYAATLRVLGAVDNGAFVAQICRDALSEYRQRPVTVRVSPSDAAAIEDLADCDAVRVVADARLTAGQCRLETHKGVYETGVEIRLESLKRAFLHGLGEPSP